MRKFLTIIVYSFLLLLIGRNLAFLPKFSLFSNKDSVLSKRTSKIQEIIQKDTKSFPGDNSVFLVDFSNGQRIGKSENEQFTAASVNKVPIVATLYYMENKGQIDLDEKVTIQEDDIQDYGTGSLRYQKPGSVLSLRSLAKLALKESDNTAAHILNNRIGPDIVQKVVNNLGLTQTDMINNKTSNADMALLFERIYKRQITNEAKTQEMLSFMQQTEIENRLSALLPSGTTIYHKTGDGLGNVHDVGIITTGNDTFYLGVLTADVSGNEEQVAQAIGKTAKDIVDYYIKARY